MLPAKPPTPPPPADFLAALAGLFTQFGKAVKTLVIKDTATQTVRSPLGTVFQTTVTTEMQITGDPAAIQAMQQAQLAASQAQAAAQAAAHAPAAPAAKGGGKKHP